MLGQDLVDAVLADLDTAPIGEPLRATLRLLGKVTRSHAEVTAADMRALLALGLSRAHIEDALHVGWAFKVITRLADSFAFRIGSQAEFEMSGKMLLKRGYMI